MWNPQINHDFRPVLVAHEKATFLCSIVLGKVADVHAPNDALHHCYAALDANACYEFGRACRGCLRARRNKR